MCEREPVSCQSRSRHGFSLLKTSSSWIGEGNEESIALSAFPFCSAISPNYRGCSLYPGFLRRLVTASQKQSTSPNVSDYTDWRKAPRSPASWTGGGIPLLNSVMRRRSGREGLGPTSPVCGCALSRRRPSRKRWPEFAPRLSREPLPALCSPCVRPSRCSQDQAQSIMGSEAPRASSFQMLLLLFLLLLRAERLRGAELTFELPDNAKQCFHEEVEQGVKFSLDYQVRPEPRLTGALARRHPERLRLAIRGCCGGRG